MTKNGKMGMLAKTITVIIIAVTIPLLLTVRGQDQRYQGRIDSMQDSLITVAIASDTTLRGRLTQIEHFHIRKEEFDKVQAKNTVKILELLGARPHEIESYPNAEDERGNHEEDNPVPVGPIVPADSGSSAGTGNDPG